MRNPAANRSHMQRRDYVDDYINTDPFPTASEESAFMMEAAVPASEVLPRAVEEGGAPLSSTPPIIRRWPVINALFIITNCELVSIYRIHIPPYL